MTIDEFMRDIAPKMRPGWVAMGVNYYGQPYRWFWYEKEPFPAKSMKTWRGDCEISDLDCFDIAPVDDWTQSLRKVGCNE